MNNEHIKRFDDLYVKMSESSDIKDMEQFGKVMREVMIYVIDHSPAYAEEMLEKLTAIEYINFLTKKEAEEITGKMIPSPQWSFNKMKSELTTRGLLTEEKPCYNEYALLTVMSMVSSDSGDTLASYVHNESELFELIWKLSVDKLKDRDKVFNIRSYFGV